MYIKYDDFLSTGRNTSKGRTSKGRPAAQPPSRCSAAPPCDAAALDPGRRALDSGLELPRGFLYGAEHERHLDPPLGFAPDGDPDLVLLRFSPDEFTLPRHIYYLNFGAPRVGVVRQLELGLVAGLSESHHSIHHHRRLIDITRASYIAEVQPLRWSVRRAWHEVPRRMVNRGGVKHGCGEVRRGR